jgi:hypothetical protein
MEVTVDTANKFAKILIVRGLGIYGENKMRKICSESGLDCNSDGTFEPLTHDNYSEKLRELMINYSKFNLPAKMTTIVLAKRYGITIPEELRTSKRRKSKYRQKIT